MTIQLYRLLIAVFLFSVLILCAVQIRLQNPILLAERFFTGGGWVEIVLIALYGSFVAYKMQNPSNVPRWRRITCTLCGDCQSACKENSIKYRYFNLRPEVSMNLFLFLTIYLHACFLAIARI